MMMRYILIHILFCFLCTTIYAQKATVTFVSKQNCEISIYEPIDGGYNYRIPTIVRKATANKPISHEILLDSCALIHCTFSQGQKCELILLPGDSIKVLVNNKQVTFRGSNDAGLQYLHDNFTTVPYSKTFTERMQGLILEYVDRKRAFSTILPEINKTIVEPTMERIDKLTLTSPTSKAFVNVLKKDIMISYNSYLILLLRSALAVNEYKVTALKDSMEIINQTDYLFKSTSAFDKEILKYQNAHLYTSQYIIFYYQNDHPTEYSGEFFEIYRNNLYAPKDMQPVLFGDGFITQLERGTKGLSFPQIKKFFNEKFPDSQYTAIINKKTNDEIGKDTIFPHSFIKDKIDSLSQLKNIPGLKGNYLFIDLWASWCMPCRVEFKYKEQLGKLLSAYKNIAVLYISIDKEAQNNAWKQCIQNFKLTGVHLRASSALQEHITKQIYGTEEFTIPRYILIDPNGEIVHKNLPRPSNASELKETLDSIIKR